MMEEGGGQPKSQTHKESKMKKKEGGAPDTNEDEIKERDRE